MVWVSVVSRPLSAWRTVVMIWRASGVGVITSGKLVAEGTIEEMRSRGGRALLIRAAPMDQARRLLEAVLSPDRVSEKDGLLSVQTDGAQAASLNRRLVADGVDVSELRMSEQSLEDIFLQLTEKVPSTNATQSIPSSAGPGQGGGAR